MVQILISCQPSLLKDIWKQKTSLQRFISHDRLLVSCYILVYMTMTLISFINSTNPVQYISNYTKNVTA